MKMTKLAQYVLIFTVIILLILTCQHLYSSISSYIQFGHIYNNLMMIMTASFSVLLLILLVMELVFLFNLWKRKKINYRLYADLCMVAAITWTGLILGGELTRANYYIYPDISVILQGIVGVFICYLLMFIANYISKQKITV